MKYLFFLAALLIGYGSLYPFDFRAQGAPFRVLFEPGPSSRGDLLQNVALFLPFGYIGMVAWRRPPRPLRFALVVGAAVLYGTALQVIQLHVGSRSGALRDVMPNVLGAAIGALAGGLPFLDVRRLGEPAGIRSTPWILAAFWLGYRLLPFVPSIDRQEWKDSLKPLRDWSPLPWLGVVHDAAAWLAVACLWVAAPLGRFTVRWLWVLMVATFGLEVAVVDNAISPANVAGAAAGVLLWALLARLPGRVAVAALLLAAVIVLGGLAPFEARAAPGAFVWVPFSGFLGGDKLTNTATFFEKLFLCGSLVWLAREAGLRLAVAAGGAALLLAGVEAAQTRFSGHTPEITDPLLALLAGLFLRMADAPHATPNPVESPDDGRRKEDL